MIYVAQGLPQKKSQGWRQKMLRKMPRDMSQTEQKHIAGFLKKIIRRLGINKTELVIVGDAMSNRIFVDSAHAKISTRPALEYYSLDLLIHACNQYELPINKTRVAIRDRNDHSAECIIRQIYQEVDMLYVITRYEEDFSELEEELFMENGMLLQCMPSIPEDADFLFDSRLYLNENFVYVWGDQQIDNHLFEALFGILKDQDYRNCGIHCRYLKGRYPEKL